MLTTLILKTKVGDQKSNSRFIELSEIADVTLPKNCEAKVIGEGGSIIASKAVGATKLTMTPEA